MRGVLAVGTLLVIGLGVLVPGPSIATSPPPPSPTSPPPPAGGPLAGLSATLIVEGLESPTDVLQLPGYDQLLVAEKPGRVVIIAGGRVAEEPVLDISDWVRDKANEQGLLTIEAHPDFATNRLLYLFFTDRDGHSQLVELTVSMSSSPVADMGSIRQVLTVPQKRRHHQSGSMVLGPEGYLWVSIGDGGGRGDPEGHAQNTATLEGTIVRLDLLGLPYSIPPDNPFFDLRTGARAEVWAYGLRNPWRISIDGEPPRVMRRLWTLGGWCYGSAEETGEIPAGVA